MKTGPSQSVDSPLLRVAVLTGGGDKPYAYGLVTELLRLKLGIDVIAGDDLDLPEFRNQPGLNFLNLRGDQNPDAGMMRKMLRVLAYYRKLIAYAATSKADVFHILWNNKFQTFDRTLLMLYYKALGKRTVLTVHNVNAGVRDGNDSWLNRVTLKVQYHLADHLFVHTNKMKQELCQQFAVPASSVTEIPFGINNSLPTTDLTPLQARQKLGINREEKVILFFGNIAPYKGLEFLLQAFQGLVAKENGFRLIIAGRPKDCEAYWTSLYSSIQEEIRKGVIVLKLEYIPDEETEVYFKASDVLVLPYTHIYQSGVLFLGHSFGLPVLASDVGSLKDDIVAGETGFMFQPGDAGDLLRCLREYFGSDLFRDLYRKRIEIRDAVAKQHSWELVGEITLGIYSKTLGISRIDAVSSSNSVDSSVGRNAHV
ncbi:MAG: glycosyltransferase family 4 protein [Acidobacteria bacterium]|nr:glycosyltransferase family 4 protein [Acidobacteriota bacterium]MBS1865018.1 glycosyltransferase family 4 protein [Acidobacteriota bacterium]